MTASALAATHVTESSQDGVAKSKTDNPISNVPTASASWITTSAPTGKNI